MLHFDLSQCWDGGPIEYCQSKKVDTGRADTACFLLTLT